LIRAVTRSQRLPRSEQPLPIVLAGGTAKPNGFRERFEKALRQRTLPFKVADVRLASDPLTATARGALVAALAER
jgi:tRNA A37 threonylcarbamoyltransferase TsaD